MINKILLLLLLLAESNQATAAAFIPRSTSRRILSASSLPKPSHPFSWISQPTTKITSLGTSYENTDTASSPLARFRFAPKYDLSNPDTWDRDIPPFAAIRHFSDSTEFDDQVIHETLNKNSVRTLEHLWNKRDEFSLFTDREKKNFHEAISNAMKTVHNMTPEDVLGGLLFYDERCDTFHLFTKDAVNVMEANYEERPSNISLVTGPSGSGKTMFALQRLMDVVNEHVDGRKIFKMHFRADSVLALTSSLNLTFAEAVLYIVQAKVESELVGFNHNDILHLALHLHVIIEEADSEPFKERFQHDSSIFDATDALVAMTPCGFEGAHVTLVGKFFETDMFDKLGLLKTLRFHMREWSKENFEAFARQTYEPKRDVVVQVVRSLHILERLAYNPRCACFLFQSIHRASLLTIDAESLKMMAGVFISQVAQRYIKSCELGKLADNSERWTVVSSLFKSYDFCGYSIPCLPELNSDRLRSAAFSVYDLFSTTLYYPLTDDSFYCASISLALEIVLFKLLNPLDQISWSRGVVALLIEWRLMVKYFFEKIPSARLSIVQAGGPFPEGGALAGFTIPAKNPWQVIQNSPGAPYADVVAPYRLLRCLRGEDYVSFDWAQVFGELGLTKSPEFAMQQATTSILYTIWERKSHVSTAVIAGDQDAHDRVGRKAFPELETNDTMCQVDPKSNLVTFGSKGKKPTSTVEVLKAFSGRSITAVIVTDAPGGLILLGNEGKIDLWIESDYTVVGEEVKLPQKIKAMLRDNVEVEFAFVEAII